MGMIETKEKVDEGQERPLLENDVRAKFISTKELDRIVIDNQRSHITWEKVYISES